MASVGEADFTKVNGNPGTWTWKDGGVACTGHPVGVTRMEKPLTNFELVCEWRHLNAGGNSGIFVWTAQESLEDLKPGVLPTGGIEVQVLDHGYTEQCEKEIGKKADWFTTNGDVFPVGTAKMKPFPPVSPDGDRSFPRKNLSQFAQWNHYYVRAINGEIRLWVNGEEVSGGSECDPRTGYLCLESEGRRWSSKICGSANCPSGGPQAAIAGCSLRFVFRRRSDSCVLGGVVGVDVSESGGGVRCR